MPLISLLAYVGSVSGPLRSICTVSVFASVRTTSVARVAGKRAARGERRLDAEHAHDRMHRLGGVARCACAETRAM